MAARTTPHEATALAPGTAQEQGSGAGWDSASTRSEGDPVIGLDTVSGSAAGWPLVLYFHHVSDHIGHYTNITPRLFENVLMRLAADFDIINPNLLGGVRAVRSGRPRVLLTFDDGYLSQYEQALPVLQRVGARALFFISSHLHTETTMPTPLTPARTHTAVVRATGGAQPAAAGQASRSVTAAPGPVAPAAPKGSAGFLEELREPLMTWAQVRRLIMLGHRVASHGCDHSAASSLDAAAWAQDLRRSGEVIEQRTRLRPTEYAYPYGLVPPNPGQVLGHYDLAFGTVKAPARPWNETPEQIRRVFIPNDPDEREHRLALWRRT
jgi:peptidoglycan/xylan/chitin deacetylase (PgdA/CDA1 family)